MTDFDALLAAQMLIVLAVVVLAWRGVLKIELKRQTAQQRTSRGRRSPGDEHDGGRSLDARP